MRRGKPIALTIAAVAVAVVLLGTGGPGSECCQEQRAGVERGNKPYAPPGC